MPFPLELIGQWGPAGLVVIMVLLGWIVPRSALKALERDRDHWREIALRSMGHTEQLLPAADITTQVTKALADVVNEPKGEA